MAASLWLLAALALGADVEFPQVLDERLQLQLVAAEPDVRTPTGIAVDGQGRVLVIESHTHFRPEGYQGPPADRILLLSDFDPATGKARKISTFFEGTKHTMNMAFAADGSLYVATRMEIFRLRDKDGDGKSDERTEVCHLETPGNYPHNGLSGMAFDFAGNLYFGFGENLGADYKLVGSDGKSLAGGGEGGNVYSCTADGKSIRRVATGFWNPFGLGMDAFGRLFCVDNDPDSRPPCRLLHVVEGGDYGFRFRNGRKGVSPFTAWNGELPGTLPMVSGTGEAPSAVMAYESDNLPEEYRGDLLVTSWGDHRLERYRLRPRGASFAAEMTTVLLGNQNFRPVSLALAPDGSLLMSDWVDKSYPLHGKGRVWRLSAKKVAAPSRPTETLAALSSPHGPWREAAAHKLTRDQGIAQVKESKSERVRSLAGRAVFSSNERWMAAAKKLETEEGAPSRGLFLTQIEQLAEAIARLTPAEFDQATKAGDAVSELLAGEDAGKGIDATLQTIRDWKPERLLARKQPIELRLAALPIFGHSTDEASAKEIADLLADPFAQAPLIAAARQDMVGVKGGDKTSNAGPFLRAILNIPPPQTYLEKFRGELKTDAKQPSVRARIVAVALKQVDNPSLRPLVGDLLRSPDETQRLIGALWAGEAKIAESRADLERLLQDGTNSRQLFEVTLAALESLGGRRPGDPRSEAAGEDYAIKLLKNPATTVAVRRFALRTLPPDQPALTKELLSGLLADADPTLRLEAIRTIRQRADADRWPQLRAVAANEQLAPQERCEAILGLTPGNADDRKLLFKLVESANAEVADEALRAIRGFDLTAAEKEQLTALAAKLTGSHKELAERALLRNPPKDLPKHEDAAAWLKLAEGEGNPQTGERVFYHLRVGGCFRCHEFEGRGERVGPDLSTIGRGLTRERLVQSIVEPSREIAPQFTNYSILLKSGEVLTGIHVGDEIDGRMKFADQNGRVFHVQPNDIDRRQPSTQSIMPAGLADNLTPQELRDLLAFLKRD